MCFELRLIHYHYYLRHPNKAFKPIIIPAPPLPLRHAPGSWPLAQIHLSQKGPAQRLYWVPGGQSQSLGLKGQPPASTFSSK